MIETRLIGETPDLARDNIEKLKSLFPDIVTDGKIDFDKLKQDLGDYVDDSAERYNFSWNGKGQALRLAQTPSTGTLRPCKEESKDWDTTQNLYIEGDNLEVLKLLQKSYYGKVKMIYIDPPYNTGKDFVYRDNFSDSIQNYKLLTGQVDEQGASISTNSETNGRYHTNWLNMMYPRLRVAKNLLTDDGLIFISINDIEVANLRAICNDVFGEYNFLAQLIWNTEGNTDNQLEIKVKHEYILIYTKDYSRKSVAVGYVIDPNTRNDSNLHKGYADNNITKNNPANPPKMIYLPKGFPSDVESLAIPRESVDEEFFNLTTKEKIVSKATIEKYGISGLPVKLDDMVIKNYMLDRECRIYGGFANSDKLTNFINNNMNPIIDDDGGELHFYLNRNGCVRYRKERDRARNIVSVLNNFGTTERMKSELKRNGIYFDYPKPVDLIKYLLKIGCDCENAIVMDFFAGSGTTAHATQLINNEDSYNRKFILIQYPEPLGEETDAYNAGFKNICDISKKRICISGEKIKEEQGGEARNLDIGFKVFKLDSSNIRKWQPDYDNLEQTLQDYIDNYVDGRTELDAVYEIMLKYGLDLTCPVEELTVSEKKVYSIGFGMLIICLDNEITPEVANGILEIATELKPETTRVVFKDNGFRSDSNKTNIKEILKCGGIDEFITL